MASKKKRPAGAKAKKGKTKAKAKPKAKTKTKAKAKAKPKAKPKAKAKVSKRRAKPPAARKRKPVAVGKPKKAPSGPVILDDVIEEPLLDASTILRVKDNVARAQRAADEDDLKQFSDPSLVVEAQTRDPRRKEDDTDPSLDGLPNLFAAEARRQKQRLADNEAPDPHDRSLFGSLGSDAPKDSDADDPDDD
jgi:hypothetical protein